MTFSLAYRMLIVLGSGLRKMNGSCPQGVLSLPGEKNTKAIVCNITITFLAQRKMGPVWPQ